MDYYPFPARLRAGYNDICEHGTATMAPDGDAVDFTGGFVPLLPLGTPACVEWLQGDKVLAALEGTSYLSTQGLLRIVDVDAVLCGKMRQVFACNTRLPARLQTPGDTSTPPFSAEILYLSTGRVTLRVAQAPAGQTHVLLNCEVDFLTLDALALTVRGQVLLRRGEVLLLCGVAPAPSDANLIALSAYAARLQQMPPAE